MSLKIRTTFFEIRMINLGRAGSTPLECARLDMIGEVVQEFTNTEGAGKLPAVLLGFIKADKVCHRIYTSLNASNLKNLGGILQDKDSARRGQICSDHRTILAGKWKQWPILRRPSTN